MTITAKCILRSRPPVGPDLITLQLRYPRFIHSEFMTHRVFSRNASSSRAVPIEKMIQEVITDTGMPVSWGKNQKGMQAGEDVDVQTQGRAMAVWEMAMMDQVGHANRLMELGLHKQVANRLLEPFAHISVIVTATDWDNFYDLRISPLADPTMCELATKMAEAAASAPVQHLDIGEWHIPYVSQDDVEAGTKFSAGTTGKIATMEPGCLLSAARSARVSYLTHDGQRPSAEKDFELANQLLKARHMSPFEHQAMVVIPGKYARSNLAMPWRQLRTFL